MNQKYIELVKRVLNDGSIYLCYDSFSTRTLIAEIIHFLLFFSLSVGLLYRKFFLMDDISKQVLWDIFLALIFLLWSLFVLMRVLLLKPKKGDGLKIDQDGISKISDESCHIKWDEVTCIYPFPWFVGIKSKGKKTLWITFFVKRFTQVTKLFGLLGTSTPKSQVGSLEKEIEIRSLLESLKEPSGKLKTENGLDV